MNVPTLPLSWRRSAARHRRAVAAVATFIAVLAALTALQPDRAPGVPVVTAVRSIAPGATLTASDLTVTEIPGHLAPTDALTSVDQAAGSAASIPVGERTILTQGMIATGQSLARPGFVVVPLPLTDEALVPLIRPGTRLDLLGARGTQGPGVLAAGVRVLATPEGERGGFAATPTRVVLIEVTPEVAVTLASAQTQGGVTIAVH